ncbi:N-acetylglutamate synthase [compost metagenome]
MKEEAIQYFWSNWGSDSNFKFYKDCVERSCDTESDIPRFYVALDEDKIIGSYAILRSDLNSRQDLAPWFACLHIEPQYRGQRLGGQLQQHAINQAKQKGYERLYLCTDLDHYYERNGWSYIGLGYSIGDDELKIYEYDIK